MIDADLYEPVADDELHATWMQAFGHCPNATDGFATVLDAYREPGRYYHTIEHGREVAAAANELSAGLSRRDIDLVCLAAWTHDARYDPAAKDNEARSADLAVAVCDQMGFSETDADELRNLILVSTHRSQPQTRLESIICDADLSGMAKPWTRYQLDVACIRAELGVESDADWNVIRHFAIGFFTDKTPFFYLDESVRRWHDSATANLAHELSTLAPLN